MFLVKVDSVTLLKDVFYEFNWNVTIPETLAASPLYLKFGASLYVAHKFNLRNYFTGDIWEKCIRMHDYAKLSQ